MAIWQFYFMLIPSKNSSLDAQSEEISSWRGRKVPDQFLDSANEILGKVDSWSSDIIQYGDLDETCIELLCENQEILEISVRLDLRTLDKKLFDKIICLTRSLDCKMLYDKKVYDIEQDILISLLRESKSARFCEDPYGYLSQL